MKKIWFFLSLTAIVIGIYILPLAGRPLLSPDESRYAEIPREMIATGNFVSPRLNGVRYFEKTPLAYWCTSVSFLIFGENRISLRLPGMLAMLGTAWIVFLLMSHYYDRSTALFGAWIYATLPVCFLIASVALTDYILTFTLTAALAAYFFAVQNNGLKRHGLLFLCGIFCGLAFLTKGFIALAVPVIVVVPWLLWEKKWKLLFTTPWLPFAGALLIVAPWGILIHLREPDFWHYFFFVEHVNRFLGGEKAQHAKSAFYFIPVFIVAIVPWLFMIPNICKGLYHKVNASPLLKFCLCGTVMPFLFFSASSGKLPTYILPCFAFTAILITAGVEEFFLKEQKTRAFHLTMLVLAIGIVIVDILLLINMLTGFPKPLFIRDDWPQIVLLFVAALGCAVIFLIAWKAQGKLKLAMFLTAFMLVTVVSNFIFPVTIQEFKAPSGFFMEVRKSLPEKNVLIICCVRPFQDICYGFRSDKVSMHPATNEIEYGLFYPESKHRHLKDFDTLERVFWEYKKTGGKVVLVMNNDDVDFFVSKLDKPVWLKKSYPGSHDGYTVGLF